MYRPLIFIKKALPPARQDGTQTDCFRSKGCVRASASDQAKSERLATMAEIANDSRNAASWLSWLSATKWLSSYRSAWPSGDLAAGVTLAAYAIPVSLAYATLAGLPPQVGVYGYLLGGLG